MKEKEKPQYSVWQNFCFMMKHAWQAKRMSVPALCVIIVLAKLGKNLMELFIVPEVLEKVEAHVPLAELLVTIGLFSLGLLLLNGLLGYLKENTLYARIDVRTHIIRDLDRKGCTTSYPNTRDPQVLKMQERANDATSSNQDAAEHVWETLADLALNVAGFAVYLGLLSNLSPILMAVVIVTSVLGFFISRRINEWGYRHREEKAAMMKQIHYIAEKAESVELAKDIRIFGLSPWLKDIYESAQRMHDAFVNRREKVYMWATVVDTVMSVARNGIAYLYLIHLAITENIPTAQFLLYFTAVSGFSNWVTGILKTYSALYKESLALSQIQEYLNLPEQFRFEGGCPIPRWDAYELRMENVTFRYPGTEKNIVENLNLTIHPGEKLAVVGLNGAGKTTLVKLLCGFYDPDQGRVTCNGVDIREFNRDEYYGQISAVFQDFALLDVTVRENVAQQVENIDEEKVKSCIEKAGLTEFVNSLPQGLNSHVGRDVFLDGILFSGGQTQRLVLARALYKDGPILMLDEPTAALDPIAENDIYRKYNEMTAGKTSVFISHRLASTRFCDRIIYVEEGRIAEEGTHEELLRLGGGYAKLFEVQSRYYREGGNF